jgi:Mn-dependent DtxR family transcriptional regulator
MHLEKNRESMESRSMGTLSFSPTDLARMCGISEDVVQSTINKMAEEKYIQFNDKSILSLDNAELVKVVEVYKGVQRRQKARTKNQAG